MNTSPAFLLRASRGQLLWLQKVPAVISIFHANSRWAQQSASHQSNHKEAFVHSVLFATDFTYWDLERNALLPH